VRHPLILYYNVYYDILMCRTNIVVAVNVLYNGARVIYTHVIFMGLLCSTMSYKTHIPQRRVCCNDAKIAIPRWRHGHDKDGFYDAPRLRLLYFIRTWRRSGSWLQSALAFESYNNIMLCLYLLSPSERLRKYCPFFAVTRGMADDRINRWKWTVNDNILIL